MEHDDCTRRTMMMMLMMMRLGVGWLVRIGRAGRRDGTPTGRWVDGGFAFSYDDCLWCNRPE